MKKAVLIGAGQYGRGVIGMLLERSGYHVLLADVNMDVVNDINSRGMYTVSRRGPSAETYIVRNIEGMSALSPGLAGKCAEADIVCTCAGLLALPKISETVARAVSLLRERDSSAFLNVLACENAVGGSTVLKRHVLSRLDEDDCIWLEEHIGFPDCAIDGIIPPSDCAFPADVAPEEYYEWDALASGFRGGFPRIEGLNIVGNLAPYLERKLFTLNGPNAVTGAFGFLKGYETVQDSLDDEEIYSEIWAMMTEAGEILSARHGFSGDEMLSYRTFIMDRFRSPYAPDRCERTVREPIRKLAPDDRIVAAMNHALDYGIQVPAYLKGIALVMTYSNPRDAQSMELQSMIRELGFRPALEKVSGIPASAVTSRQIEEEYLRIMEKYRR